MVESENRDQKVKISSSGLSPFRYSLYRAFWIAALFSYIGMTMYDVAASWLMTSLAPNPLFVSFITTAGTLPIFLFALPSGALSDIFDRSNIILITCGYMFTVSIILGILTLLNITTPSLLLVFTFALGAGATMIKTPIIPTMSALVSRSELPAALTLSVIASSISRAVGPTIAGFIVTAIGPWGVFFITSFSFIGMIIIVLRKLSRKSQVQTSLPPENIIGSIRAQIRYVRHSQAAHVLIVRAGLFTLCSSALLSLLPLLARHELRLDSTGFGLLLGSFGTGAIIGGIAILPKLRLRTSVESLITISIGLLAGVIFMMGYIHDFAILCIMMGIGGVAYVTILSQLYVIGIKSAPKWIGARVLAVYLLILNGGLAIGSVIWGIIANTIGIPITLSVASLALAATIITRKRYSTTFVDDLDLTPAGSDYWPLPPQFSIDPANSEGHALVTIDYKIDPKLSEEFEKDVLKLGSFLKSEGMTYWKLFQDPADNSHYLEIRIADTWSDHMRQHQRVTKNVKLMEDRIRELLRDCPQPIVSHYVAKSASK